MVHFIYLAVCCFSHWCSFGNDHAQRKVSEISPATPLPPRFVTRGTELVDLQKNKSDFFRGIGYSPVSAQ